MDPLSSIDDERLRALRGVIFDIDDTLTTHGMLTEAAYSALWRLARPDLTLIAVTGRPLGWTDAMAMTWPIALAIGENGAGWSYREARALRVAYFDGEEARATQAQLLLRIIARVRQEMPGVRPASDQGARRCDLAYDVGEAARLSASEIARLVAIIEAEGARALVSSVHAHAICGGWDKAQGCLRGVQAALGTNLAAERERWLFVGDSGNDAAAFAFFPFSVGVANVAAHLSRLPVPPAYVTRAACGDGFAELAARIAKARHG